MSHRIILSGLTAQLVVTGIVTMACPSLAGECSLCKVLCPYCGDRVCITTAKPAKEKRHCWDVECTEVCIPAVRFPWECCDADECLDGALPKCGKVRCVRKLKKSEYERDVCEYEHTIGCRCPHCGPLSGAACIPPVTQEAFAPVETKHETDRELETPSEPRASAPLRHRIGGALRKTLRLRDTSGELADPDSDARLTQRVGHSLTQTSSDTPSR